MERTRENFTAAITAVVERAGRDYVYELPSGEIDGVYHESSSCRYIDPYEGGPSCLIAQALDYMGIGVDPSWDEFEKLAYVVLVELGFDQTTAWAAGAAQGSQDTQNNWGKALDAYNNAILNTNESEPTNE